MIRVGRQSNETGTSSDSSVAHDRRFRALYEHAAVGIVIADRAGRFVEANPAFLRMLGYTEEELKARTRFDVSHPDDMARHARSDAEMQAGRLRSYILEKRYLRKDGGSIWCRVTASVVPDDHGVPDRFIAVVEDISERKRAEVALRESEARTAQIAANVPGLVYEFAYRPDGSRGYTFVSEGARAMFGIEPEEALRDHTVLLDLVHSEERDDFIVRARDAAARLVPFHWEGRVVLPSGAERIMRVDARDHRDADGAIVSDGLITDVTAQRELEAQLRQAQKMEAVGRLAGGVAHDFNNLLMVIQTSCEFAAEDLPADSPAQADLATVRDAARRAAALTGQLLAFSRRQFLRPESLDLNAVVSGVAAMLGRVIGEDVRLQIELAPAACRVLADAGQLEQVLLNLAVNARDAMPGGGTITVRTERRSARDGGGDAAAAETIALVVADTGAGIDPAVLPHVFEPFFTTKPTGAGTGLGLATVYGIVQQSGGRVVAESAPGQGACFTVLLPAHEDVDDHSPGDSYSTIPRGTETILLVEDEAIVRAVVRRQLEALGYGVREADGARAALHAADACERFDLVLTDVVMPELDGRALVGELAARGVRAPVVFMTGYTDDEILRRGLMSPSAIYLTKPFSVDRLAVAVRRALDAPRTAP